MQLKDFEGNRPESIKLNVILPMELYPKTRKGFVACFHPQNWQLISYLDKT